MASLDWLVERKLPHLDAADLVRAEALRVRHFVREYRSEWFVKRPVYGEDGTLVGSEPRLALVGETSIARTLFTEPERVPGGVPRQFLQLLDYLIAYASRTAPSPTAPPSTPLSPPRADADRSRRYRFTQADCERVGRAMTLTKTKLRTSLGDEHFKECVWVAYNSPGIHEVDLQAFVQRWRLDGHLSAMMSDGAERAREVLDRKARERKHSFLAMEREG